MIEKSEKWSRLKPQILLVFSTVSYLIFGAIGYQILDPKLAELSFFDVIFFEFIMLTTIGYGNVSPTTNGSRIFTIFYCLIGIPLIIVTLANFGKHLTKAYWHVMDAFGHKYATSKLARDAEMPIPFIIFLFFLTYLIGSMTVKHTGIEYSIDDVYFSFISFATVGFGDKIPLTNTGGRMVMTSLYLVWGMMLTTALFSVVHGYLIKVQYLGRRFTGARDVDVYMGEKSMKVSKLISVIANEFEASPKEIREILHALDHLIEETQPENDAPLATLEDFDEI